MHYKFILFFIDLLLTMVCLNSSYNKKRSSIYFKIIRFVDASTIESNIMKK